MHVKMRRRESTEYELKIIVWVNVCWMFDVDPLLPFSSFDLCLRSILFMYCNICTCSFICTRLEEHIKYWYCCLAVNKNNLYKYINLKRFPQKQRKKRKKKIQCQMSYSKPVKFGIVFEFSELQNTVLLVFFAFLNFIFIFSSILGKMKGSTLTWKRLFWWNSIVTHSGCEQFFWSLLNSKPENKF